jgi:HEAT repeat protein
MKVVLSLVALLAACLAPARPLAQSPAAARPAAPQTRTRGATIEELIARLKDKNQEVAGGALGALVERGAEAVPHLERLLKSEKDAAVLLRAAVALGEIRPEHASVVATLVRVAKGRGLLDSEETLMARRTAGMFLSQTPAGIRALPALLKDDDVFVRRSAAFALDDPTEVMDSLGAARLEAVGEVLPALVSALDDGDEVVRGMSCEVLGQIVRSKVKPLSSKAERLLKERGKSRGECLCECE